MNIHNFNFFYFLVNEWRLDLIEELEFFICWSISSTNLVNIHHAILYNFLFFLFSLFTPKLGINSGNNWLLIWTQSSRKQCVESAVPVEGPTRRWSTHAPIFFSQLFFFSFEFWLLNSFSYRSTLNFHPIIIYGQFFGRLVLGINKLGVV